MKLLLSFTFLCFLAIHTKAQTDHFNLIDWQTLTETQINLLPMFGQKPKTEKEQIAYFLLLMRFYKCLRKHKT